MEVEILPFTKELKDHIKILNLEWLEKYFTVEPIDLLQLSDPENEIINKGGLIYYAKINDVIVGTATLLKIDDQIFELGKMAVKDNYQGFGIGKKLLEHCIDIVGQTDSTNLILYSNTKLTTAIKLYEKYGFIEVEMDKSHYTRANIKMELKKV